MQRVRSNNKGFTLVEILIVVIILGILAAIVIPQFSNASTDAKKNSLTSQLQTMRSQFELYKLQHNDKLPILFQADGTVSDWTQMTGQTWVSGTAAVGATSGDQVYGPYLQQTPTNPLNGHTECAVSASDSIPGAANTGGQVGFLMNRTTGKLWGTSALMGYVYDESTPSNGVNEQ
jgi:general secretion pathway protein G